MSKKEAKKLARQQAKLEKEKNLLKDVFLRELKLGEFSIRRREKEWKKMLMKIAVPHVREELELAWINFERIVDNKDMEIAYYLEELNNNENQYSMNFKNHLEHLDEFIALFLQRMKAMKVEFNNNISLLEKDFEEDVGGITDTWKEEEEYLKTVLYMLESIKKGQKADLQAKYFNGIEESGTKTIQQMQRIRSLADDLHTTIEADAENIFTEYYQQLKKTQVKYDKLTTRDNSLKEDLSLQLTKLQNLYETIRNLKVQLIHEKIFLGRKLKETESEWHFYNNAHTALKKRLDNDRQRDANRVDTLTLSNNETVRHLEKIIQKGEHILQMAAVCRKLETQEEKIQPFPSLRPEDKIKIDIDVQERVYNKNLDLFWQKVAQAEVSRNALNEERSFLRRENELLQKELHEYCQCLNCPVPQSEVNAKVNYAPQDSKLSKNVTDGNMELKKYNKSHLSFG